MQGKRAELKRLLQAQWRQLVTINPSDRPWQKPFAAALASGLPLLIGTLLGRMDYGLVAALGGLVYLYTPRTPLYHRMLTVMTCAFAMIACYTLGLMSHFVPLLMMPTLVFVTILVTMASRFYGLGPPGSLFFVMAASIGAYTPMTWEQVPLMVGLLAMGALLACLIAFFYSAYILRSREPDPAPPLPVPTFDFVVFDAVLIGACVGLALAIAQALQLEKAYWVPVSCLAVIQGASLQAVWNRQLHRLLGTAIGLLLAWGLFLLPLERWSIVLAMMLLTFVVETAVVRHYGFAVIFITPMTILLAEAATLGQNPVAALIEARFYDTLLGCLVGLAGGACIHSVRFRAVVGRQLRRLVPARFGRGGD